MHFRYARRNDLRIGESDRRFHWRKADAPIITRRSGFGSLTRLLGGQISFGV
jgi:hypothetical protein